MSEYKILPYEDKGKYQILSSGITSSEFSIICDSKEQAHKLYLSLLLETTPNPIKASELYFFVKKEMKNDKYVNFYIPKDLLLEDDPIDDMNSCCQSGCKGCPHFKGF